MKKIYMSFISLLLLVALHNASQAQNSSSSGQPFYLGKSENLVKQLKDQGNASKMRNANPSLDLVISKSRSFHAKVNFNQSLGTNNESFIGEIENTPSSSFYLRIDGKFIEGNIVLRNSKEAYKYYSDENGNAYVKEVSIHDVLCINLDKHVLPSSSLRTEAVAIGPAVANLQSFPGGNGCALLDFDGQYVSGTPWNNGNPIDAQPSTMTDAQIQEAWEMISEDYRPFHINITTNEAVYNTYPKNRRMRCIITPTNTAAPGSGGVAYVGSFNWNDDTPCWVFNSGAKAAGEAASHEIGHTFGLRHDGRTSPAESYYAGQGTWAPIMGVGYNKSLTQWSKGEYTSANNSEDDLVKISSATYGVGYKTDDYGNTIATASSLKYDAAGKVSISGLIERTTDIDFFSFTTGGGTMALNFSPAARHADLDILATLYNSSGAVVTTSNPTTLSASFNIALTQGTYYISVDGTGSGDPAATGYSDYSSLGYYAISGTIPAVTPTTIATFFQNCNNDPVGYAIGLDVGSYTSAQLLAKGIANNSISSLKINAGYEVVLYKNDNFSGDTLLLRADNLCLNNSINDSTSSLKIRPLKNQLPFVTIQSPVNGASFTEPASIIISANATDSDGAITKVEFFNGSAKIGEDLTAPYSFTWANVAIGAYTLTAKATDNAGAVGSSVLVNIQVNSGVGATVYKHCNYNTSGYAVSLAPGTYTLAQLNAKGVLDNDISSLKVRSGYEVILYQSDNFQGNAYVFRGDISCLVSVMVNNTTLNINDWTSSLVIRLSAGTAAYPLASASDMENVSYNNEIPNSIMMSPNPVADRLTVQFDNASIMIANVQVFNMHKKEVLTLDKVESGDQIDLSTLSSGLYFVRINLGKYIIIRRIVKY